MKKRADGETPAGPFLSARRMRALEDASMASGAVTGAALMERAGRGAVDAILARWPALAAAPAAAVVLCGPGNNGGDGLVVARLLRARGWDVAVRLWGDPARMRGDAAAMLAAWDGPAAPLEAPGLIDAAHDAALVIDALFGTGLSRALALPGEVEALFHGLMADGFWPAGRAWPPYVVALDLPSGLSSETGRPVAGAEEVGAHLTVAFSHAKPGHVLAEGPARCGALRVVDLGLGDPPPGEGVLRGVARPEADDFGTPFVARKGEGAPGAGDHKFAHGHALVLSGGVGRGGAARMAARGALRIGAGLVTLGCPPGAVLENGARLDAVMVRPVADAAALEAALGDARITALCLGPGLGTGPREARLVGAALASGRPCVLDADALTLVAGDPGLAAGLHPRCVLTPHGGEFARLAPDGAGAEDKVAATRAASARLGAWVVHKGPDTVIAGPDGDAALHAAAYGRAAPWLATAGAGDVLAGMVAGLLARGFAPGPAAEAAVWCHAEAARAVGPGLIAEDLPEALPAVLRDLAG